MAEFPTYEQMAKDVADKALDEYLINGKTLREWITIIAEQEPCEDAISRRAVLDIIDRYSESQSNVYDVTQDCISNVIALPSVQSKTKQEHREDVVSREAAISIIYDYEYKKDMRKALEDLPSVTPAKNTGHWTIKQYQVPIENKRVPTISDITFLPIEPTACKTVYTYTHSACKSEEYLNKYNYCPNCGCKMESGVSE